jgi:pyruvate,water dikinase
MADRTPWEARKVDVGAKLWRLGAVAASGFRVPDGFALDRHEIARCASGRPLPGAIRARIEREHRALCRRLGSDPPLAVRSAALAEDGQEHSFAGQLDSVLGVRGVAGIEAAVLRCIASFEAPRVAAYRSDFGLATTGLSIGVQQLVRARASGVAFSQHPVSHRRDRLVIEAALGFGSAVGDGSVTPDHIEVGRSDRRVLERRVANKSLRAVLGADGVRMETVPAEERRQPSLDDTTIGRIVEIVIALEERLGHPVDIEWATDDRGVVVVQARPIAGAPTSSTAPPQWDPLAYASALGFGGAESDR